MGSIIEILSNIFLIPTQTTALSCSRFSVLYKEHFAFLTMVRLHVRSGLRTRFHHGNSWSRGSRLIWFFSVSLKHYRVRADRELRRPFLGGHCLSVDIRNRTLGLRMRGRFFLCVGSMTGGTANLQSCSRLGQLVRGPYTPLDVCAGGPNCLAYAFFSLTRCESAPAFFLLA